jgi:Stabilization of polarity axis
VVERIIGRRAFVCGSNNALFLQKSEWWDVCCDLSTGNIYESSSVTQITTTEDHLVAENAAHMGGQQPQKVKLRAFRRRTTSGRSASLLSHSLPVVGHSRASGGIEMAFISRVLHDMEYQAEGWVRRQFHDFTLSFLNRVGRRDIQADLTTALAGLFPSAGIMQSKFAKFAENYPATNLWKIYRERQDETWGGRKSSPDRGSQALVQETMPSPTNSQGADDDGAFFVIRGKSLAPFMLEAITGLMRPPTGFIKVEESSKRASSNLEKGISFSEKRDEKAKHIRSPSNEDRWIRVVSESGEAYFWNVATGVTSWESPDDQLL